MIAPLLNSLSKSVKSKFLWVIPVLSLLFACGPARHLNEDQRLLAKIKLESKKGDSYQDDLLSLSKQKPNRKLLGMFKIYLGIYNLYYDKEDSKIKEKIGEPPVIYDSTLNEQSVELMEKYLNNRGYYDNDVSWEHKLSKKKAKLKYKIDKGERYQISKLSYEITNKEFEKIFFEDSTESLVKINEPFDLETMKKERARIEKLFRNHGYYKFSREFVVFEADTFKSTKTAEVNLSIKNKLDKFGDTDSLVESSHKKFKLSKIYVRMNYSAQRLNNLEGDTTMVDSLAFVELGRYQLRKDILARLIYMRPGDYYSIDDQEESYANLSGLRVFSYVSIKYEEDYNQNGENLIVYIDLNPSKQKSLTLETEGTNNGGNLGVNSSVSFQNNNTFNGAELLNIRLSGGLEAQRILTDDESQNDLAGEFFPFNTYEFGPEVSLEVPRFLLPFNNSRFSVRGNPRTTFNASYNFQERPDYTRNVSKAYVAYSWNETPTKTHIVQPIDLSFIKLDPSQEFQEVLENINNPFLRNSYTDNLILALKYSFILNTQNSQKDKKNHIFFRANAESAGNAISAVTQGSNLEQNEDGSYNLLGIRYAQYVRSDIDFRYYQNFDYNQMVYRFAAGIGIPYGNSTAMPFEKSFYAGGANGIRAWRARQLGPGALPDSSESDVDQIGNMSLEGNVELRFPITDIIEGAAFVDAGNIWNVDQEDSRENTKFELSRLWQSTAVGLGAGIRLNFTFFILRLDIATPVKDPSELDPYMIKARWKQTNLNLGIGYPF